MLTLRKVLTELPGLREAWAGEHPVSEVALTVTADYEHFLLTYVVPAAGDRKDLSCADVLYPGDVYTVNDASGREIFSFGRVDALGVIVGR